MDLADLDRLASIHGREALRFEFVDEQGWDESCGYAALSSLLRLYRGLDVREGDLLARSGEGDLAVSLGRLIAVVRDLGCEAHPWRATYDALQRLAARSAPVLVHYDRPDGHFALVLAAGEHGVVVADPARGLELLTRSQFEARWSGVALEVIDPIHPDQGLAAARTVAASRFRRAELLERALSRPPQLRYFEGP